MAEIIEPEEFKAARRKIALAELVRQGKELQRYSEILRKQWIELKRTLK